MRKALASELHIGAVKSHVLIYTTVIESIVIKIKMHVKKV